MPHDPDGSREQGIEFGELLDDLDDESYPLSHETVLERYGDCELGLPGKEVTLREVLAPEDDEQYEDADSVRQAVFNMVGGEAVGREEYSDRGGNTQEVNDSTETESF